MGRWEAQLDHHLTLPALRAGHRPVALGAPGECCATARGRRRASRTCRGNPLYAEEFIRMLARPGDPRALRLALRTVAGEGGVPVPETVQALIGARLDTLSVDRKTLLQNASVIRKVFWSGTVASMGGLREGPAREALHDLTRKELVRTVRTSSVQDQTEYSVWHAVVRDVAYGQIPRAERAAKHLAVAAWIESTVGERISDQAEFLAYHCGMRSSCPRPRVGPGRRASGQDSPRPPNGRRARPAPGHGQGAGLLQARRGSSASRRSGVPDAPRQDPRRGVRPRPRVESRDGSGLRGGGRTPPAAGDVVGAG